MQVRMVTRKSKYIEKLINDTYKRYNNFNDFYVKPHDVLTDTYDIFLYFDEVKQLDNENIIQVEIIKNILYKEISSFIEQVKNDFNNLIEIEIFQNKDKKHLAFVVLKFEVKRDNPEVNPVDVYYMRWSGGSNLGGCEIGMDIAKYIKGEPYALSRCVFSESLCITSLYKGLIIRLQYSIDNYDILFEVKWDKQSNLYTLKEYSEIVDVNFRKERLISNELEVKMVDTKRLTDCLVKKLEKSLKVNISNRSINHIEEKIIEIAECSELNIVKNEYEL